MSTMNRSSSIEFSPEWRLRMASNFLEALHGFAVSQHAQYLSLTAFPSKHSEYFQCTASAAKRAVELAEHSDIYVGCGSVERPIAIGRGRRTDIASIPGFWADIDWVDLVHKKAANLPPSNDAVFSILHRFRPPPSLLTESGHGIHAFWLFDEPWILKTEADRIEAESYTKGWIRKLERAAAPYRIDHVGDLSRILRVPGTFNWKTQPPLPVQLRGLLPCKIDLIRYKRELLLPLVIPSRTVGLPNAFTGQLPRPKCAFSDSMLLNLLLLDQRIARLWSGNLKGADNDHSRADMIICVRLAKLVGPDPSRIDNLFRFSRLYRQKWDDVHFGDGSTYGQMTIRRAISFSLGKLEKFK